MVAASLVLTQFRARVLFGGRVFAVLDEFAIADEEGFTGFI